MKQVVRHYQTGAWVHVATDGPAITAVHAADGPATVGDADDWIAPAFWDIQTNGRWGISFSDPALTVEQVVEIVQAQAELGTARLCPTLITAPRGDLHHGVRTLAQACAADPTIAA